MGCITHNLTADWSVEILMRNAYEMCSIVLLTLTYTTKEVSNTSCRVKPNSINIALQGLFD